MKNMNYTCTLSCVKKNIAQIQNTKQNSHIQSTSYCGLYALCKIKSFLQMESIFKNEEKEGNVLNCKKGIIIIYHNSALFPQACQY